MSKKPIGGKLFLLIKIFNFYQKQQLLSKEFLPVSYTLRKEVSTALFFAKIVDDVGRKPQNMGAFWVVVYDNCCKLW